MKPGGGMREAEQIFAGALREILRLLENMKRPNRRRIREVLETIIGGQELDLKRFNGATAGGSPPFKPVRSWMITLTVLPAAWGKFWTRMCRAHLIPDAAIDDEAMLRKGIRFGKGLKLVNILRDIPQDLRRMACYIAGIAGSPLV